LYFNALIAQHHAKLQKNQELKVKTNKPLKFFLEFKKKIKDGEQINISM